MTRRALLVGAAVAVLATACSAPRLSEPTPAEPPAAEAPSAAIPECTEAEAAAIDPRASYQPDGPLPAADALPAGSTMAAIRDKGRLTVGVSGDTLQFGARNPLSGALEGFDIAMLQEVAKAIFGPDGAERIDYVVITYGERIPKLKSGEVDMVAHTMTINCKRWKQIAFSSVYYDAGQKVLVPKGSTATSVQDLVAAKARICYPSGSTNADEMAKPAYAGHVPVLRADASDCMVLLQQGEVDAVTADDTVLVGFVAQDPNVKIVGPAITEEPYGLGIAAERVDLVRFVNALLDAMRADGRWAELYRTWVGTEVPEPPTALYGR